MTGAEYCVLYEKSPDTAYNALFEEYCGYVHTIVYSKLNSCGTREDIEECISDVFTEIFLKYNKQYDGDLKGYIGTIARRKAINMYHTVSARVKNTDYDLSELQSDTDMERDSEKAELRELILKSIEELGEPDSTIIIQRYYYNRSLSDIAKHLSMNSSTVRVKCRRAMQKLGEKLKNLVN